jgi:hypothetical protein
MKRILVGYFACVSDISLNLLHLKLVKDEQSGLLNIFPHMDCLTVTINQTLIAIFHVGIEVEEIAQTQTKLSNSYAALQSSMAISQPTEKNKIYHR